MDETSFNANNGQDDRKKMWNFRHFGTCVRHFGTKTNWHPDNSAPQLDKSAPQKDKSALF